MTHKIKHLYAHKLSNPIRRMSSKALFKKKKSSAWSRTKLKRIPGTKVEKIIMAQSAPRNNLKLEKKYLDTSFAAIASTTGSIVQLNAIAEGAENNQRTGRQVLIRSLQIKGYITPNGAFTNSDLAEIRLYWHKDPLAALPTVASFLQGGTVSSLTFNNVDNEEAVICIGIIKISCFTDNVASDFVINIDEKSGATFDKFYKINEKSRWSNSGAVNPLSGGLYAVVVSDHAAASASIVVNVNCRIRYLEV